MVRDSETLDRQRDDNLRSAQDLGDDEPVIYEDQQSGADDDRLGFEQLLAAIATKQRDCLVIDRIDRITRDIEANARIAKLLQRTGVKLWENLAGRFIDFNNPGDWEYFVRSGLEANYYIRRLAHTIRKGKERQRRLGKAQGGRLPYGYQRTPEGIYQPNPDQWLRALERIQWWLETRSLVETAARIYTEHGEKVSYEGLARWLRSPVIRGHIPYYSVAKGAKYEENRNRQQPIEVRYNQHQALLTGELLTEVDQSLADSRRYRGRNSSKQPYSLSGLLWCAHCGQPCTITKNGNHTYAYCRDYRVRNGRSLCGNRDESLGKGGIRYDKVISAVIASLCQRSELLAGIGTAVTPLDEPAPDPKILELERAIASVEALIRQVSDESGLLRQKIRELEAQRPIQQQGSQVDLGQLRSLLLTAGADPDYWNCLTVQEQRALFLRLVRRIEIDRSTETVRVDLSV